MDTTTLPTLLCVRRAARRVEPDASAQLLCPRGRGPRPGRPKWRPRSRAPCHLAIQARVPRAVDLTHATRAEGCEDLIGPEARSGFDSQGPLPSAILQLALLEPATTTG